MPQNGKDHKKPNDGWKLNTIFKRRKIDISANIALYLAIIPATFVSMIKYTKQYQHGSKTLFYFTSQGKLKGPL